MISVRTLVTVTAAAGLALSACGSTHGGRSSAPGSPTEAPSGEFVVEYTDATTPEGEAEATFLRERTVLEDFAANMNDYVRIPRNVKVVGAVCDEANAWYVQDDHTITFCYEYPASARADFGEDGLHGDRLDDAVYEDSVATLYHEAGHALIGELDLKVTGREEDVADQMAAYVLTANEDSKEYLLTASDAYTLSGSKVGEITSSAMADPHALDEQRATNFLCWVYGSDVDTFAYLVDDDYLDQDRAAGCAEEYDLMAAAWERLLAPYVKD